MKKAVLISMKPKNVELVLNGYETLEIRKTRPRLETPFKCYIYCTNTRPFLVWGDVFRGDWVTEFTRLFGYGRAEADRTWDVFNGKVVGEFTCNKVTNLFSNSRFWLNEDDVLQTCLSAAEIRKYAGGANGLYGWHISDLKIYAQPKPLSAFKGLCKIKVGCWECPYYNYTKMDCDGRTIKRPPQSWCYVEELKK